MNQNFRPGTNPVFNTDKASNLLQMSERTLRHQCETGKITDAYKNSDTGAWCIPLSALPPLAQARYLAKNLPDVPGGWQLEDQRELSDEEAKVLWEFFEGTTKPRKQQAYKDTEACLAWQAMKAQGIHFSEALIQIRQEFGLGKSALYEKINRIKGHDPMHWPALLVGQWRGENVRRAEWPNQAWQFFLQNVLTPGCSIRTAWHRTKRHAEKQGWPAIPCYDTAKSDFRKLPHDVVTLVKEGETALKVKSPTAIRDYDFPLHTVWSMDGRRMDLIVKDTKGKYGQVGRVFRPWIYAFLEVRSRMILGYALGSNLDADLVRSAFLDSIKTTERIVPRSVQPDNGMETAAKEITGGAPWRRRGKVMDDEIIGLFPMLGIEVDWATVAHGQTKPVERAFGTLAQRVETRPEFRGAYCGNSPNTRPEEWAAENAIPIELVETALKVEIADYHRTIHRGNGMNGKSPLQVYTEKINALGVSSRRISEPLLRICTYSAAPITIRRDASFTILGAVYWSEGTTKLLPGKGYYARYNPHDLSSIVYIYRKEKCLCEATRKELTAFNDKAAGKEIMRKRATYTKAVKQHAKALQDLAGSDTQEYIQSLSREVLPETFSKIDSESLPAAQVLEIVKSRAELLEKPITDKTLETENLRKEATKLKNQATDSVAEQYRKRAMTGRR